MCTKSVMCFPEFYRKYHIYHLTLNIRRELKVWCKYTLELPFNIQFHWSQISNIWVKFPPSKIFLSPTAPQRNIEWVFHCAVCDWWYSGCRTSKAICSPNTRNLYYSHRLSPEVILASKREDKMGVACSTLSRYEMHTEFWSENPMGREPWKM